MKISTTSKAIQKIDKKYCRLVLNNQKEGRHRLVEKTDGTLELRYGVGSFDSVNARKFRTLIRTIVRLAKNHEVTHLALNWNDFEFSKLKEYGETWLASTISENLLMADYEFTTYKAKDKNKVDLKEVLICGELSKSAKQGLKRGQTVGEATNLTRDIANTPACDMTPKKLAEDTKKALKGTAAKVKVLGETELKKLKMNLLLTVGQATKEESKLILIEYYGAKDKKQKPLVLVGKGVTYDTGGLNVKPSGGMHDMHMDMSGGASVIGAMQAIAKLGLKKNVVGIIPAAENAVSEKAMRAGDIVKAMNGKTVEVLHTDAEGRLILADALTYSERYKPKAIIDVATLTGAALVALGQHASAVLSKDEELANKLKETGEKSGDYLWPLPLWDEYQEPLKTPRADISNIAHNFSRFAGTIEGGAFLENFVPKNVPYAHIDMASRMESIPSDKLYKGAAGEMVRMFVTYAED